MTNREKINELGGVLLEPEGSGSDKYFLMVSEKWLDSEYKEPDHIADTSEMVEPTTKNNLGVDAVSRQEVLDLIADYDLSMGQVVRGIHALPSVTPQPCEDTISRVDAINCLAGQIELNPSDVPAVNEYLKGVDKRLHELSSVTPQPRWIPVSEYLPVTNDEVLVTYIVNGNAKKRYVETANCFDGEWSSVNDEYRIPNTKIEIIAWCEMPKPYKAESEDKE